MMRYLRTGWTTSLLLTLAAGAIGCQNRMHDENLALHQQNRELQEKLSDSQTRLHSAPDPNQVSSMQQEIAQRDQKIAELEAQLRQPGPGQTNLSSGSDGSSPENSLAGIEVTRDERAGTVTVRVPGDVLFDAGKATLKDSARSTLNKIAAALKKDYSGKKIFVVGHTDSDPITKTKGIWDDNLDLSAARAERWLSISRIRGSATGSSARRRWATPSRGKARPPAAAWKSSCPRAIRIGE